MGVLVVVAAVVLSFIYGIYRLGPTHYIQFGVDSRQFATGDQLSDRKV